LISNPLKPAGPDILYFYVSVKLYVSSLYSLAFSVAILIKGLVFFPRKIFTAKNKINAPKENQCTTLWLLNGSLSYEIINLFFLIKKRVSGQDAELIFIAI